MLPPEALGEGPSCLPQLGAPGALGQVAASLLSPPLRSCGLLPCASPKFPLLITGRAHSSSSMTSSLLICLDFAVLCLQRPYFQMRSRSPCCALSLLFAQRTGCCSSAQASSGFPSHSEQGQGLHNGPQALPCLGSLLYSRLTPAPGPLHGHSRS